MLKLCKKVGTCVETEDEIGFEKMDSSDVNIPGKAEVVMMWNQVGLLVIIYLGTGIWRKRLSITWCGMGTLVLATH